ACCKEPPRRRRRYSVSRTGLSKPPAVWVIAAGRETAWRRSPRLKSISRGSVLKRIKSLASRRPAVGSSIGLTRQRVRKCAGFFYQRSIVRWHKDSWRIRRPLSAAAAEDRGWRMEDSHSILYPPSSMLCNSPRRFGSGNWVVFWRPATQTNRRWLLLSL